MQTLIKEMDSDTHYSSLKATLKEEIIQINRKIQEKVHLFTHSILQKGEKSSRKTKVKEKY